MNIRHTIILLCFGVVSATSPLCADDVSKAGGPGGQGQHSQTGSLSRQDDTLSTGEYIDSIEMDFRAGDVVTIDLTSNQFDTYLLVRSDRDPNLELDNDDHRESTEHSQIVFEVETTGTYTIGVTSYEARETGRYQLTVSVESRGGQDRPERGHNDPTTRLRERGPQRDRQSRRDDTGGPRMLGVFVGISDYPGTDSDLNYCDQDAVNLHNVLQREFGMHSDDAALLTNDEATVENVVAALRELGQRARPQDMLVFFYSGHGGQSMGSTQSADPDGMHETLALYNGELIDDDFAEMFNASPAGTALVMLDSCFSGGFAKDVVSVDGRMGIFSSEEDVQSMVPSNIEAGGYLSSFVVDALSSDRNRSDLNNDRQLTAHEFSHYLGERYREDVRSGGVFKSGTPVDPGEDLSYQRLVVDRGGVGSDDVLFTWR